MAVAGGNLVVAGGGEFKNFEGRTTSYLVFICLLIASCGLMFGYDIGINGECSWVSINSTYNLAYIYDEFCSPRLELIVERTLFEH